MQITRKSILKLSCAGARSFLLKPESYCSFQLPKYLKFSVLLGEIDKYLLDSQVTDKVKVMQFYKNFLGGAKKCEDVNYTIFTHKSRYAWRPLQLIHPVLYVSLVHEITKEKSWEFLLSRFNEFSSKNSKIACLSLPVISTSKRKDKAEQILEWWEEVEQRSIELSLDYQYLLKTDITDCYGAIYTHSIPWALHTKELAKQGRACLCLLGNKIDQHIQCMQYGQTNGIPQGSVLMDFIAEIVLGYADSELSKKIEDTKIEGKKIEDYRILRYRDDYRIFVNNLQEGEYILKFLTETVIEFGWNLNPIKTQVSDDVIRSSIKNDKWAWICRNQIEKINKNPQRYLFNVYDHSIQFANSGSVVKALCKFSDLYRPSVNSNNSNHIMQLIAIVTDIAYQNPCQQLIVICAAILSKLVNSLANDREKIEVVEKIRKRFKHIPNTGYLEIWIQRIIRSFAPDIDYKEKICVLPYKKKYKALEQRVDS